ncbi:MAG: MFS transporter [Fibrobacteria bacterium]
MIRSDAQPFVAPSLFGAGLAMFLVFVGISAGQFHSYLFESRGIGHLRIGILIMAGQGAGILSPLFQIIIIRRFHGPRLPLMLMIAGSGLALAVLPHLRGFWPMLIGFCIFTFCGAGIFPLNAACTFEALRHRGHGIFFRIRTLGTVGFLVGSAVSVFFPRLTDLPMLYAGFAGALFASLIVIGRDYRQTASLAASMASSASHASRALAVSAAIPGFFKSLALLREPRTLQLLIVLGAMNFANSMATGVQGNYLVDRWHEGQRAISMAWVVSTACEVPWMLFCAWVLRKYGLRYVIGFGIAGTLVKLTGLALAGQVWHYYLALTLHGCFFSGALTGFSVYLDRAYRHEERSSLQALAPVFYAGIPSSLAGLATGVVWHSFSLRAVYLLAGGIAALAAAYAVLLFRTGAWAGVRNAP